MDEYFVDAHITTFCVPQYNKHSVSLYRTRSAFGLSSTGVVHWLPELSRAIRWRGRWIRHVVQIMFLGGQLTNADDDLPLPVGHETVVQEHGVGVNDIGP